MEVDNKTLDKYLAEVRRVKESRSEDAEKEIRKLYKGLLKELNSFIGEYYTKYSNDEGILNAAILQQNAKYAAFLEEVDKNINDVTPEVSKSIKKTVEDTYKICYKGMVNAFSQAVDSEKVKESFKGLSIKPEVMKAAVQNPVGGLTLPERLKKNRQEVVYDIKQNIANALMTGERYDTTAKKIAERLDVSYGKAIRIVRTESHRVQEKGLMDGAEETANKIRDDGLIYAAIWRNMGDSRVRPYSRVHTSKGWKTVRSKTHANHVKMEGQIIEAGGYFDLGDGVKAKSPGESGDAANDINCRCYVEYEVMTVDEFVERGGRFKDTPERNYSGLSAKISGDGVPEHEEPILLKKIDINNEDLINKELKNFEDYAIRENIETACVITKDGEVYKCFGINDAVYPDFDLGDKLKGAIVSHNHPIEETEFSFSNEDIDLFIKYDLKILRGCDERYIYEINRNADDIDPLMSIGELMDSDDSYRHNKVIERAMENGFGYKRRKI